MSSRPSSASEKAGADRESEIPRCWQAATEKTLTVASASLSTSAQSRATPRTGGYGDLGHKLDEDEQWIEHPFRSQRQRDKQANWNGGDHRKSETHNDL